MNVAIVSMTVTRYALTPTAHTSVAVRKDS